VPSSATDPAAARGRNVDAGTEQRIEYARAETDFNLALRAREHEPEGPGLRIDR
jgi:hypothetical protein